MKELAKRANVSVSTVSKAFSGAEDIGADTRELIFKIAKEAGCYGKFYKGKYDKKVIAIICPELISSYYNAFAEALRARIEASGNIVVVAADMFSVKRQSELIEYFASYINVDGIIVMGLKADIKSGFDVPIVSMLSSGDHYNVDSVNHDSKISVTSAISFLYEKGHRNIAFFSEALTKSKAERFMEKSTLFKLENYSVFETEKRFEDAGKECVKKMMESGKEFTAVICAYDNIAFGAMRAFKKLGIRIPDDISVMGIDNISQSEFSETSLTTVGVSADEVAAVTWELLQKKLSNPYFKSKQKITINSAIVERESVKNINH